MKIRQATDADIGAMTHLLDQLFSIERDFEPDAGRQGRGLGMLLERADACVVVAERQGEVVGMATMQTLVSTAQGGHVGLLEDLVVDASCRGRGIGKAMVNRLLDWAAAKGLTRVQLLADRNNQPALAFYQSQDWSVTDLIALRKL
jgi:ribosomal protein S18 acetylase RimI-like enzyme